jgi:L-alanine-DL-glutamate epimerase-like enolase superfamily enzyme
LPRIESIGFARLTLPLRGVFRIAYSAEATAETVMVAVRLSDGTIGYGEASPSRHVTWEDISSVESYVNTIARQLKGLNLPDQLGEALRRIHAVGYGFSSARAALESAVLDAASKVLGVKLYILLGGRVVDSLYTDYTVSIPEHSVVEEIAVGKGRSYEAFVESIEYLVGLRGKAPEDAPIPLPEINGFRVLKVKVGTGRLDYDEALVNTVYQASRDRARIRIDANQAWKPKQAIRIISKLESRLGTALELVEQPVPSWDVDGLKLVREHVETPVAADESARSPVEVARIASLQAADVINIKIMKAGGPLQAARIASMAEAHGLQVMWGCMAETSLGISQAVHAALASEATAYVDLDSPLFLKEEPMARPARYTVDDKGVRIEAPDAPGLGVEPSQNLLAKIRWL